MQIPEGYRLQLEGLTIEHKRIIADALGHRGGMLSATCLYNGGSSINAQGGTEDMYNSVARALTPIYIAEELQQSAPEPEQAEIDLGATRWAGGTPEILFGDALAERQAIRRAAEDSYISFDDVEPFEDF